MVKHLPVSSPSRRSIFIGAGATLAASACKQRSPEISAPSLAITIDDFNPSDDARFDFSGRDSEIRKALKRHGLKAAAFPTGENAETSKVSSALTDWAVDGHVIGNHSYSHGYYGGKDPDGMMQDFMKAEAILNGYSTFQKRLRFPYLAEGKTALGRDALRKLVKENGYQNAHVTIDASDWYISGRLNKRLRADALADVMPYRDYYLAHLWGRAVYYNDLAVKLTGRADIPHTLLVHHNLINGLFLGDVLEMFKSKGWGLTHADDAYADPIYDQSPLSLPAGQSLIWAMARAEGGYEDDLRYPAEDGRYEQDAMDLAGL